MWLYWCLLSTIISGFTAIALKKCSNNEPKRIALMGLLSYHLIMIAVSIITNPGFITKLNIADMINILPGILMQSIGFYCMISATKYGKVAITSSISKANVVVTGGLGKNIAALCKRQFDYDPELLIKGMYIIYKKNSQK